MTRKPLLAAPLFLSFLVESSPSLSPHEFGRLLSLVHHVSALRGRHDDRLRTKNMSFKINLICLVPGHLSLQT